MLRPDERSVASRSTLDEQEANRTHGFLGGGGELGERIRAMDWSKTPLGAVETWPAPLRTCVRIILTSKQPMFVWWGDQLINIYNDAYKAIVGGKHPVALGQPASVVWSEIWDVISPRVASAMQGDEGTYDEALLLIMRRNGYPEETYYTFSYSPVPDGHGGAGGVFCANTDDTRRIIGERQLALLREIASHLVGVRSASEACVRAARAISTATRDLPFAAIYLMEPDHAGLSLAATSGIEPGLALAPRRLPLDAISPFPVATVTTKDASAAVSELPDAIGPVPTGAWSEAPKRVAVLPIKSAHEATPRGVIVVGLNPYRLFDDDYSGFLELVAGQISAGIANAEAYEREKRRSEALAELDRAKTTFFSNVSHEFRTPLTLILGPVEDAMASASRTLDFENLQTVYRNSIRLMKLVNALLDFSRIEAGRIVASYEPTDLSALAQDLASAFRSAIERAGLSFELDVEPSSEPVYLDRDMWEKIVLNLLSNALKFTLDGSIRVGLRYLPTHAELTVTDTGSGIPEKDLPHVFERFHRVDGVRARTNEGSGIGLALVNELVRLHGGEASIASTVGAGTKITITIPRGTAHLPEDRIRRGAERPFTGRAAAPFVLEAERWLPAGERQEDELDEPAPPETGGARILLADDNADMRDYLLRLLRTRWTVEAVGDGKAALAAVRELEPDLVLTDVMMPHLDGFGLLAALRSDRRTRHIPVVMLSARAGEESRIEGLEAGADDYLVKPFSARELLARVATHLQIARLRRVAEAERARLFDVLEQAPVPVAVFSGSELRFELANPPYCEMVGRTSLIGRTLKDALPEIGDHPVVASLESVYRGGRPLRVTEFRVPVLRSGVVAEAFFDYVAQPLRGSAGDVSGIILVANEVTEQVVARRRVEELRAAAENASRAKDEFLSTLSHELRTPLNAIVGWSSLLSAGAIPQAQVGRAVETIERNARVQARLIDDMLDLSRIEQGKLVLSVGPLEMVRIVEAAIDAVRPAAEAKGVRLQPVLDSHATTVGDADRLQQVVWNLLSNAIKFTSRGGRVLVRLRRDQSHVEVVVSDTGQGIDPEFLPHVFDRFRQGDGAFTRKAGGLGLGLAIVRSLVELHGGNVAAYSDGRDRGSTFTVRLPMAPLRAPSAYAPEPNASVDAPRTFECPPELVGLHVLVVDDEPATRDLLRFVLEQSEAKVATAASASEALALLGETAFDVLVSDIGMPDVDGYSLMRAVRSVPPEKGGAIPALALTAYARSDDRTQALRAGFNMHLAKPIEPTELLVAIAALVNGHQRRRVVTRVTGTEPEA